MTFIYNGIRLRQTLGKEVQLNIATKTTESLFRRNITEKEIEHLKRVFENVNGYSNLVTTEIIELVQNNVSDNSAGITSNESITTNRHTLILLDHKFQIPQNGTKLENVKCPEKHCEKVCSSETVEEFQNK